MKDTPVISFTTIITLLIIIFAEATRNLLAQYFKEVYILLGGAFLAFIFFILVDHTYLIKRKYKQIGRITMILCMSLAIESFANYFINEAGLWISSVTIILVIYIMAWYGYVETHKLKPL